MPENVIDENEYEESLKRLSRELNELDAAIQTGKIPVGELGKKFKAFAKAKKHMVKYFPEFIIHKLASPSSALSLNIESGDFDRESGRTEVWELKKFLDPFCEGPRKSDVYTLLRPPIAYVNSVNRCRKNKGIQIVEGSGMRSGFEVNVNPAEMVYRVFFMLFMDMVNATKIQMITCDIDDTGNGAYRISTNNKSGFPMDEWEINAMKTGIATQNVTSVVRKYGGSVQLESCTGARPYLKVVLTLPSYRV